MATTASSPTPVSQIAPGVYHFDTYPFNWYVLEEQGRLTLVDAGFPGHIDAFRDGLRSIGRELSDIEGIVLTHAHADHVGFAGPLSREAQIPIYIHPSDRAMVENVLQLPWFGLLSNAWRPFTAIDMLSNALRNGLLSERKLMGTVPLRDGQTLDLPGRPRVLHVPGHTPGTVVLLLGDRNIILAGDTLVTEDLRTGTSSPPSFPHILYNGDDKLARKSIGALKELGAVTLLPGHGLPWSGQVADAIDAALIRV